MCAVAAEAGGVLAVAAVEADEEPGWACAAFRAGFAGSVLPESEHGDSRLPGGAGEGVEGVCAGIGEALGVIEEEV